MSFSDLDLAKTATKKISSVVKKAKNEVNTILTQFKRKKIDAIPGKTIEETREAKILYALNKARNDAGKVVKETSEKTNNIVLMADTSGVEEEMYISGLNIQADTTILQVTANVSVILSQPTETSGAGTGSLTICWFPDAGDSFGVINPSDIDETGYTVHLIYQTQDGNGDRIGDLRLSNFDQIFDYSEEFTELDLSYESSSVVTPPY